MALMLGPGAARTGSGSAGDTDVPACHLQAAAVIADLYLKC